MDCMIYQLEVGNIRKSLKMLWFGCFALVGVNSIHNFLMENFKEQ